jgi:hypothetical protein
VDIAALAVHLAGHAEACEYPAQALQALEIVINAPFLRDDKFLYQSRGLYELSQANVRPCALLVFSYH